MNIRPSRSLRTLLSTASFAAASLATPAVSASTYDFGTMYKGSFQDYATLDVNGVGGSTWTFSLKLLDNFDNIFSNDAFAGSLAVNAANSPDNIGVSGIAGGGVFNVASSNANGPQGFDFRFKLGSGSNHLTAGETINWTADFTDTLCSGKEHHKTCTTDPFDVATSGASPFALHIQNIGREDDSRWAYATAATATTVPVPEPETYIMMLTGLGIMGFVIRRRQRR
jgi:hypothetical protein